jgi:hypothetical protein
MNSHRRSAVTRFLVSFSFHALLVAVACAIASPPAGAAPVDRKTLAGQQAMFIQIEMTQVGTHEFGTVPKDSLTDGAFKRNRTVKFEVPLSMPIPGSPPPSLMSAVSMTELSEQDRFVGWMASPPEMDGMEETITSGKLDPSKNPMFVPARYTVDDVEQSRYRDSPADGFGTNTTIIKGSGSVYAALSGMVLCDLKKLVCDIANIPGGFNDWTDKLTTSTTSDVPGFEPKKEPRSPSLGIPQISQALGKQLTGMTISLQDPFSKTFTAPGPGPTGGDSTDGTTVTMKVTLSSKSWNPPAIPAAKK